MSRRPGRRRRWTRAPVASRLLAALVGVGALAVAVAAVGPVQHPAGERAAAATAPADPPGAGAAARVCAPERGPTVFALSADGRRSAFACTYATGGDPPWRTGLYLVDPTSGQARRIEDEILDGPGSLAWSPDGRRLAYFATVDLGPAPVGAGELRVHDAAMGQKTRLDRGRHFAGAPVWTPDGTAVLYRVGSWQHSTRLHVTPEYPDGVGVATFRAPVDGGGGALWAAGVHAVAPGPEGRWLGVREPQEVEGLGEVVVVAPDGATTALTAPGAVERPLGWLGGDPVVWRQSVGATARTGPRGDVWVLGSAPRRLLVEVPRPDALDGATRLEGERLRYTDGGGTTHDVHLPTGQARRIGG